MYQDNSFHPHTLVVERPSISIAEGAPHAPRGCSIRELWCEGWDGFPGSGGFEAMSDIMPPDTIWTHMVSRGGRWGKL